MSELRHFLDLDQLDAATLREVLVLGAAYKRGDRPHGKERPLEGRTLAMIFEKPSTRTRVSFEVGVRQLGGDAVILTHSDSQLGRGESIADTARVLSRYADAIMIRTASIEVLNELVAHATVPVINGLTDVTHPCQLMADVMTFEEHRGPIAGKTVAWCGDGNNVAASWIHAAVRFDFELRLACPTGLRPPPAIVDWARHNKGKIFFTEDVGEAVKGVDCVVTDTWVSMGNEGNGNQHKILGAYRVDERVMSLAHAQAIFMHCLPAHRGDEVTAEVIDGPRSVVWDEAENRLHAQKGILTWCLC